MNRYSFFSAVFVVAVLSSCVYFKKDKKPETKPIAKAYENFLYPNDIKGIVPKGSKPADSISIVKEFIQHWLDEQTLLHQAENNLTEQQMDLSKQIEDYKNSLIIYTYEKELVRQKLDTNVTNAEVEEYYNQNKKDFQLKNDIVKIIYVKVRHKAPGTDKLRSLMTSDNPKDKEKLAKYCYQYAENFFLDESAWLMFDDVLKEIPIQTYNEDLFLQNNNNHFVQIDDTARSYFLSIKGYMVKNSMSPLSFEKENIKKILLNKRKMELIDDMKKNLLNDAMGKNEVQVY
ncbi:MAG TPA: hypothetical protein VK806_02360 [Bacteroidia bacterium]|nr:hypothetical protein [Bacteroidia bacterium]